MKEYAKNTKKYICRKYEGIRRNMSIYWIWHFHIYMGLRTWKNSEHHLHTVSGTWKNSEFSSFIWANWDLEKLLRKILSSASI